MKPMHGEAEIEFFSRPQDAGYTTAFCCILQAPRSKRVYSGNGITPLIALACAIRHCGEDRAWGF